jgi:bifunctional non-homologous end joining protein LigD
VPDADQAAVVAGMRISHPGRVLFDELGLTKEALARFYESVSEWMIPELKARPLSLVRCPAGPGEGCFYQKNIDEKFPAEIERVRVEFGVGGTYAAANTPAAVVGLVQMGVIELHTWGSTTRDLSRPDRMIFDLDPDVAVPWRQVMSAAQLVRERLADLELESFVKTTGGKGLHVVVPLARRHDWDEVKQFSRAFAEAMVHEDPKRFVSKMAKKERVRKIFIDWLRNGEGATAVAPYSVRAREGAPVATPLHWDELGGRLKPTQFHAGNVARRMHGLRTDPWQPMRRTSQNLTAAMKRKLEIET